MRKKSEIGGFIQFSNYTPPNPTSPSYPIKNERSLKCNNINYRAKNHVVMFCFGLQSIARFINELVLLQHT